MTNSKERAIIGYQQRDVGQDHGTRGNDPSYREGYRSEGYAESDRKRRASNELAISTGRAALGLEINDQAIVTDGAPRIAYTTDENSSPEYNPQTHDDLLKEFKRFLKRKEITGEDRTTALEAFSTDPTIRFMVHGLSSAPSARRPALLRPRRR